jgi:hypothetical protein
MRGMIQSFPRNTWHPGIISTIAIRLVGAVHLNLPRRLGSIAAAYNLIEVYRPTSELWGSLVERRDQLVSYDNYLVAKWRRGFDWKKWSQNRECLR